MSDLAANPPSAAPLLEVRGLAKYYGNIIALEDISTTVEAGKVTCVLGDNGAGKSSFIKILSGVHHHDAGEVLLDGEEVQFKSPRDALDRGIATVYQDLAVVPLMSVWRNFWLGDEPRRGIWPIRWVDIPKAKRVAKEELLKMGIDIRDTEQFVGTLSGGERQSVAIARAAVPGASGLIRVEPTTAPRVDSAVDHPDFHTFPDAHSANDPLRIEARAARDAEHKASLERKSVAIARASYRGARVLILDEPTSALGVKQSGVVLRYIVEAARRNLGVIFITHNPNHAYPVGDRFLILNRGRSLGNFAKEEISQDQLTALMAGGAELRELQHELAQAR